LNDIAFAWVWGEDFALVRWLLLKVLCLKLIFIWVWKADVGIVVGVGAIVMGFYYCGYEPLHSIMICNYFIIVET
jgi:hypothetical protein